jgi:hypothetical protein
LRMRIADAGCGSGWRMRIADTGAGAALDAVAALASTTDAAAATDRCGAIPQQRPCIPGALSCSRSRERRSEVAARAQAAHCRQGAVGPFLAGTPGYRTPGVLTHVNMWSILRWVARPRHPKKEIEDAIQYAERLGWTCEKASGHAWGRLYCPHGDRGGCILSVWSTPRSPGNHAHQIRRQVDRCPHASEAQADHEE